MIYIVTTTMCQEYNCQADQLPANCRHPLHVECPPKVDELIRLGEGQYCKVVSVLHDPSRGDIYLVVTSTLALY